MQRIYGGILIVVLTILTVFSTTQAVFAESTNEAYADGKYELPFEVWQSNEDEASVAGEYFEKPAILIVENGEYTVQTTLKNDAWWQYFQVASGDSFIDVTEVSKDEKNDTSVVQFEVESLENILQAKIHIIVTGIPGFEYDSKHDIRIKFDAGSISTVPEKDLIDLENGNYTIEFDTLHETEEKPSTAASYLKNPAFLSVQDGKGQMTLTLTDDESIQDFKTEQNGEFVSAEVVEVNKSANTRVVTFDIDDIESVINAKIKVYIAKMDYTGEYGIRLVLDKDSIKEFDGNIEDEEEVTELNNGHYTINYRVLHETEFEKSRMGDYMVTPAKLVLNEDKKTVMISITDHEVVTDFQIEQNGEFQQARIVNVNEQDNTRDISFEIDKLDAVVNAKVKITFGDAYSAEHVVRIFFEENSVIETEMPFSDIDTHWGKVDIITAYENGWFKGFNDREFKPENSIRRIQAASLFTRILGLTERSKVPFTDIRGIEDETIEELEKAYANGVINGYSNQTFKPYANVTRAQLALMIYRSYEKVTGAPYEPKQASGFPDIAAYDEETQTAIAMLKELEIVQGSNGKFLPNNQATRAHAAKMLVNYKEVLDAIEIE